MVKVNGVKMSKGKKRKMVGTHNTNVRGSVSPRSGPLVVHPGAPDSNMYTSLSRSKDFVKVLPNTWALAEWHPEAATSAPKSSTKKRRRRARRQSQGTAEVPANETGTIKRGPGRPRKVQPVVTHVPN